MNHISSSVNGTTVVQRGSKTYVNGVLLPECTTQQSMLKRFGVLFVSFVLGFASGYLFNVYF